MPSVATTRLERWQEKWADRLNPMLVRESRRLMKSRQLTSSFGLALLAAWLVSAWEVLQIGGAPEALEIGRDFFVGYHAVLDACLFFAVPFGVFRNMSSEFREQSFEVLAISTLRAERIVFGKLQCGLLEMAMYLSAIAPFVCLTFLMGGVGVLGILGCLLLSFVGSVLLCLYGGMLGSLAKKPGWEAFNAALLVLPAIGVFGLSRVIGHEVIHGTTGGWESIIGFAACTGAILFFGGAILLAITIDQFHPTIPYPHFAEHMSEQHRRAMHDKNLNPEYRRLMNARFRKSRDVPPPRADRE
ncbi:MAG: hypothetical protein WD066_06835 [Planctomycetaceae bacterium]